MEINIKTCSIALVATGSLLAAGVAKADMVTLSQNAYSYNNGGEFSAVFSSTPNQSIEVFCDEISTVFSPGTSYSYKYVTTDSEGYGLSEGAAYLYSLFNAGTLPGYDYTDASKRNADAGELQAALWALTGQAVTGTGETAAYTPPTIGNNTFYALAYSKLAFPLSANNGLYPVDIMQLYNADGSAAQAQFVPVPAPEVPMTHAMVFGSIALAGYGLLRRKSAVTAKA